MKSVSAERLLSLPPHAVLFDTRPKARFAEDGLPQARHLTLEEVQAGALPELPQDQPLYLICERGQVSELVGLYLEAAGFQEVYNIAGGMAAWRALQNAADK